MPKRVQEHITYRATLRTVFVAAALGFALLVVVAMAQQPWTSSTPNAPATPEPAAPIEADGGADQRVGPGAQPAAYLFSDDRFAGRLLHWTQVTRSFNPGSPDAQNGVDVVGSIWVLVNDNGGAEAFSGIYTKRDGTFVQAAVERPGTAAVHFGVSQEAAPSCQVFATRPDALSQVLPLFVALGTLDDAGFVDAGTVAFEVPQPDAKEAESAVAQYEASAPMSFKHTETFGDGVRRTATVYVDEDSGRFVGEHNVRYSPDGELLSEYFLQVSTLVVYDPEHFDPGSVIPALEDYCEN